jgi:hypothetical protein
MNVTEQLIINTRLTKIPAIAAEGFNLSRYVKTSDSSFSLFDRRESLRNRNTLQDWDAFNPSEEGGDFNNSAWALTT